MKKYTAIQFIVTIEILADKSIYSWIKIKEQDNESWLIDNNWEKIKRQNN